MASRVKNKRCPLQEECDKKCEFVNHELDCTYYKNNATGDSVIEDQEVIRNAKELTCAREQEVILLKNIEVDKEFEGEKCSDLITHR